MNVSLRILGKSSPRCNQGDDQVPSTKRLDCCVTIEQNLFRPTNFDTVQIALRGRLKTQIDGLVSTVEVCAFFPA
jgi:hypothetical protein